jgi:hypothetical protein
MRVQDLIFLDDLRGLGIDWIDRLAGNCTSHEDVARVWALIRAWGPDQDDVTSALGLSSHVPRLERDAGKMLTLIRLCENYRF